MHKIASIFIFIVSFSVMADEPRRILIPSRAQEVLSHFKKSPDGLLLGDSALIEISSGQVEEVAELIHQKFGGCGGFFDVTAELKEGVGPDALFSKFAGAPKVALYSEFSPVVHREQVAQLLHYVDSNSIKSFLVELSSFDDRSASTDNGTRAADFIAQRALDIGKQRNGFEVRKVATKTYPKQPSIVATVVGNDPSLAHVVIGAHMDTLSYNKPGADDDGSGSTVVMEALRSIIEAKAHFDRTIDFIWYAAEERGLVGSANVVKEFQKNNIKVSAAIQFDMTGWVNPVGIHDIYLTDDHVDAGLNKTLESIINTYLPSLSVGHASCGYACSDHATWTANKVPAVYPFESHHDDYNRRIHTSSDKIDYLSIEHMTKFAKIAVAFLGQMATF